MKYHKNSLLTILPRNRPKLWALNAQSLGNRCPTHGLLMPITWALSAHLMGIGRPTNEHRHVKIYGTLPTGGTLSRSYTFKKNSWTAEAIKWTDLQTTGFDATTGIALAKDKDAENPASPAANDTLNLDNTKFHRWGATFYAPSTTQFIPTIAVTYDVTMEDEKGTEVITRENVTSTIILDKQYFSTLKPESTATIYPINILIQPRYLYVLADQDAWSGFLLVDK